MESKAVAGERLFGHPRGLFVLAFTEMCERFSTFGIRAIMVLYMVAALADGGLGWTQKTALLVLGAFQMGTCLTDVPGGIIADKWLGARRSVWLGCLFNVLGAFALALPGLGAFFTGLALLAIGGGLFKPNVMTNLSRLYEADDPHKESSFTVFYLAVNVGSFFSGLVVGCLVMKYGWRMGFLAAGFGMLLGQIAFTRGLRHLKRDEFAANPAAATVERHPLTADERRRIWVCLFAFVSVLAFLISYEQANGLLNLYANASTDRMLGSFEVPAPWFQSLNPLLIIVLAPLAAVLWTYLGNRKRNPHPITKMGVGMVILGLGYVSMVCAVLQRDAAPSHQSSMIWLVLVYLACTVGELWHSPVALSFITGMAPKRMTSQVMGWYFAVAGVGGFLASWLGSLAGGLGELKVFVILSVVATLVGVLQLLFAKKVIRLAERESAGN